MAHALNKKGSFRRSLSRVFVYSLFVGFFCLSSFSISLPKARTVVFTDNLRINITRKAFVNSSLIRDQTIYWDPNAHRMWLDPKLNEFQRPPAMLLLTNLEYNQADQTKNLQLARNIRTKELITGVVNHP